MERKTATQDIACSVAYFCTGGVDTSAKCITSLGETWESMIEMNIYNSIKAVLPKIIT